MKLDLNEADGGLDLQTFNVCVCGTDPAGVTVARKLAVDGKSVVLVEAADLDLTDESQDVYEGENVGLQYWGVSGYQLRQLGGTSNHWAGRCSLFAPIDFEDREYFGLPGWPISRKRLLSGLPEASSILDLGSQSLEADDDPAWQGTSLAWLDPHAARRRALVRSSVPNWKRPTGSRWWSMPKGWTGRSTTATEGRSGRWPWRPPRKWQSLTSPGFSYASQCWNDLELTVSGHCHHMGTTRMSADPKFGVVDPSMKVHGLDNLFIAGSSVFPTGGATSPTLSIVLLSLLLGDHIATSGVAR